MQRDTQSIALTRTNKHGLHTVHEPSSGGPLRTLVWFRGKDLRISDHAPLSAAAEGGEVIPLFVLDPYFFAPERAQELPHRMQFLLESLVALEGNLRARGSDLLVVAGPSTHVVPKLARLLEIDRIVAHRWVEPFGRKRDDIVRRKLAAKAPSIVFELYEGETLIPPGTLRSGAGTPFSVYSPFARALRKELALAEPLPPPKRLPAIPRNVLERVERTAIPGLEALGLVHNPRLLPGGERAARARLEAFIESRIETYAEARDQLAVEGTSRLSADLKFGTLSVRSVLHAARALPESTGRRRFEDELLWREFAHSTLWDRPELLDEPFRPEFEHFPWRFDERGWKAWTEGLTGYPVVDAAARQLLCEGYVHNRARMIAASFLTKHLMIHYREGEAHYLRYLTDGDWAQNNLGWQWSAGCGCDAQPYFRVFNPITQGEKFDAEGTYVRAHVPELERMPARYIHAPWTAPASVLEAAGVRLGETYPLPIVDHAAARARFLEAASILKRVPKDGSA